MRFTSRAGAERRQCCSLTHRHALCQSWMRTSTNDTTALRLALRQMHSCDLRSGKHCACGASHHTSSKPMPKRRTLYQRSSKVSCLLRAGRRPLRLCPLWRVAHPRHIPSSPTAARTRRNNCGNSRAVDVVVVNPVGRDSHWIDRGHRNQMVQPQRSRVQTIQLPEQPAFRSLRPSIGR